MLKSNVDHEATATCIEIVVINYSRMIPVYLAEMKSLQQSDPDIYSELLDGNWIANKNFNISFCGLGAENGLEHLNRSMKV